MRISGVTYVSKRTHAFKGVFLSIVSIAAAVVIITAVLAALSGWQLTHPAKEPIPVFSSNIMPEYSNVSFTDTSEKINLKGWFFDVSGSETTVIIAHGYGKNRLQFGEQTAFMLKSFVQNGYSVLAFDLRNSGLSDGKSTSLGQYEKDDLTAAVKYVKNRGAKNIILLGFSTGASASLLAASDTSVNAVVADSAFPEFSDCSRLESTLWNKLPSFPFKQVTPLFVNILTNVDVNAASPSLYMSRLGGKPVLFIYGDSDKSIPLKTGLSLYEKYRGMAGENAQLWQIPEAKHAGGYLASPEQYMEKVLDFIKSAVKK